MKIKKNDLISALKIASKFTGSSFEINKCVLIDGPNSQIVASDNETTAIVDVEITDAYRHITPEVDIEPIEIPGDAFQAELMELKKVQLESLSEYAGIENISGTKKSLAEAIWAASILSANKEQEAITNAVTPDPVEVPERFAVNPLKMLKIINSLEGKKDEIVNLAVSEFSYEDDSILSSVQAQSLNVGEHFQKLPLKSAEDFRYHQVDKQFSPLLNVKGNDLNSVAKILNPKSEKAVALCLLVDAENNHLVGCDIKRLHMIKCEIAGDKNITLPARCVKNVACLAKDKNIEMAQAKESDQTRMIFENVTVYTENMDLDYPDYIELFQKDPTHTVLLSKEKMEEVIRQVTLVVDDGVGVPFTFNGGLTVELSGKKGDYVRENIPFEKGGVTPAISANFNPFFVQDTLSCMGDKVKIGLQGELSNDPIFFYKDKTFAACIMPMMK